MICVIIKKRVTCAFLQAEAAGHTVFMGRCNSVNIGTVTGSFDILKEIVKESRQRDKSLVKSYSRALSDVRYLQDYRKREWVGG